MTDMEMARKLAECVSSAGGCVYFVGGFVRDRLLGHECKDIDVEVHGITPPLLCEILDSLGKRMTIGESFGIYGLKGFSLDIAMPRLETAVGRGHKDFEVSVDPFVGTLNAAKRRDFTINALMQNVLTGEVIDHFGGVEDLKNGVLRHVNPVTFPEDPLRVLRGAQFAARFNFSVAPETVKLCRSIDLSTLSKERIEGELKKALLKAKKPSIFFEVLREMDQLDCWFPELKQLIGLEQNPEFHPEGDVWTHSMMVTDTAAAYLDQVKNPFGFMLSALVHDLGKIVSTELVKGKIHAYGHETKGLPIVAEFMHRITNESALIKYVMNMSELHMRPNVLASCNAAVKSTNRVFDLSVCPNDLIYLASADLLGKNKAGQCEDTLKFLFDRLAIYEEVMSRPFVGGKDLIDAGLKPDRNFSEILAYAHKLRLAGVDKRSAMNQTLSFARKLRSQNLSAGK